MNNDKVIEKVTDYIDVMAAKLGVAGEHVYGLLVRQQMIQGILDIVFGVLFLSMVIFLTVFIIRVYTKAEFETVSGTFHSRKNPLNKYAKIQLLIEGVDGFFYPPFIIAQIILLSLGIAFVYCGALGVINPEYFAIRELLDVVGGSK